METWYRAELPKVNLVTKKKEKKRVVDSQQVLYYVRPGVSHRTRDSYCVPCRMLTRGKESVKREKLSQPHRTGPQQEQPDCLLGSLSPYRTRNDGQAVKCPKCGTHLPIGSRLNTYWELAKL